MVPCLLILFLERALRQASHSPASLGFLLSSQRRVDGDEIFHLKEPYLKIFYVYQRIIGGCAPSHISFDPIGCVAAQSLLQ